MDITNLGPFQVKVKIDFEIEFEEKYDFAIEQATMAAHMQSMLDKLADSYRDLATESLAKYFQQRGCIQIADDPITIFKQQKEGIILP